MCFYIYWKKIINIYIFVLWNIIILPKKKKSTFFETFTFNNVFLYLLEICHKMLHFYKNNSQIWPLKCQVTLRLHMPSCMPRLKLTSCEFHWSITLLPHWFVFPPLQACTSAFATKDRLRSHMIRHEGKVTCNICGKMLSAAYITSHLKTHGQAGFTSPCNKGIPILHQFSNVLWDDFHTHREASLFTVDNIRC